MIFSTNSDTINHKQRPKIIFKKISVFAILLTLVSLLFAEPASTGITDSDVKNWAKNLNSIQKELDALGVMSNNSINATAKQKASVDKILQKYGINWKLTRKPTKNYSFN